MRRYATEHIYSDGLEDHYAAADKMQEDIENISKDWHISFEFAQMLYEQGTRDEDTFEEILSYWLNFNDDESNMLEWLETLLADDAIDEDTFKDKVETFEL